MKDKACASERNIMTPNCPGQGHSAAASPGFSHISIRFGLH